MAGEFAGHGATVHAAIIEDGALVGMGATVLDGSKVCTSFLLAHLCLPYFLKLYIIGLLISLPC
jgi:hypothetical protein